MSSHAVKEAPSNAEDSARDESKLTSKLDVNIADIYLPSMEKNHHFVEVFLKEMGSDESISALNNPKDINRKRSLSKLLSCSYDPNIFNRQPFET